ncbi:hypothetical protein PVPAM_120078500 [Plasmodium vivax]|nr:hypothetical protein PVPAM_120078500 [Plasmodium vivax]
MFFQFLNDSVLYYNRLLLVDACSEIGKHQNILKDFNVKYNEALQCIKKIYSDINPKPMNKDEEAKKSCATDSEKSPEENEDQFILFSSLTSDSRTRRPPTELSDAGPIYQDSIPQDSQGSTFTPLGTYLRKNKLIDRYRMNEKQDDNYKLLSDASRIPHNIAYQPVGN